MVMPLWDESPFRLPKWPVVTWGLIIANIVVFVFELAAPQGLIAAYAVNPAILTGRAVEPGGVSPYLTLITYMFLHNDVLHIFGNMLFLWIFGDDVEEAMGPLRFIVFYFVCGIVAALVFVASAPQSTSPLIGASGAIAGVLAAYLMFRPCQKVAVFLPWFFLWLFVRPVVRIDAFWVLGVWILTQFWAISVQSQAGVAYMAHVGGLVAGAILFPLLRRRDVRLFECVRAAPTGPWPSG
jgi:membrane associated rhomboid family serine protease